MNQYLLKKDCKELHAFPHVIEFAFKKNSTVQFNSFKREISEFLRFYYVLDGRFDWKIEDRHYLLYPNDLAIVFPGQKFGGEKDLLDIGTVSWMHIELEQLDRNGKITMGNWSRLGESEATIMGRLLMLNNSQVIARMKDAGVLFQGIHSEFVNQEIGFVVRINQMIDELFIMIARQLTRHSIGSRDFPETFMKLEKTLRGNLSHQWTVEEMAALVGLGTTAFSEKVKSFSGFSPLNYLINIRISEAIKLLRRKDTQIADLAFTIGFYSSQHFATTFKKLTGYTPSEYRKKHIASSDQIS